MQKVQKEESNAAVKQHLQIMHEYGHKVAQAATAKDVDVAMRQIMDSQMSLSQEGFDRVVSVNQSMQATLADVRIFRSITGHGTVASFASSFADCCCEGSMGSK